MRRGDVLLQGFLAGETRAEQVVRDHVERVVAFKGRYVPRSERDDVVQEAMQALWAEVSRPGFRSRGEFEAFVRRIAHRRCVDWYRRRTRANRLMGRWATHHLRVELPVSPNRPDLGVIDSEKRVLRDRVLAELRESHRELIRLRVVRNLGYRQIADLQGRTEEAIRRQWCDCLLEASRIRQRLEGAADTRRSGATE